MEEGEFSVLFHSYRELREAVAVNGFYSLVAGLIIATFIFKLLDMANDSMPSISLNWAGNIFSARP